MKTIIIVLMAATLATGCTQEPRVKRDLTLAEKHHSYSPARWKKVDDHYEYGDSNVMAKSVQEYKSIYNSLEAEARFNIINHRGK